MAENNAQNPSGGKPAPKGIAIESLGSESDPAVFAGVCAMQGWEPGKQVSRQDWNTAVKRFLGSPISGPEEEN